MINLQKPIRFEKVRSFQPPWITYAVYKGPLCETETRTRIYNKWLPIGAIYCQCELKEKELKT